METELNRTQFLNFLVECPAKFDYNFNDNVRRHIRRALFFSASHGGEYLSHFFSGSLSNDMLTWEKVRNKMDKYDNNSWIINYNESENLSHPQMTCSRLFQKGEPIYRCLTCGFDDTCALCSYCFREEDHKDHKVHINICQKEKGGVCDCGDPEAWIKEFKCPHYEKETLTEDTFPKNFEDSLFNTIDVALDYILDVMSKSTLTFDKLDKAEKIQSYSDSCDLKSGKYGGSDINSSKYYLMAYNDQTRQFRDVVQRIHLSTNKVTEFGIMVAEEIQEYGKAKVIGSDNITLLLEREKILSSTGLTTCIRSYRDIFREDMCDEIIRWLRKLTEGPLFKDYLFTRDLLCQSFCRRWDPGVGHSNIETNYVTGELQKDNTIPKIPFSNGSDKSPYWKFTPSMWELPPDLCKNCDYNLNLNDYTAKYHLGSKLQYFIYFDIRFWKSIREILHELYITVLITNLKYKNLICCQYIDIYPTIADMFLNIDREPEFSIMCTLSAQLFTCPSNSTAIVQHGDLLKIFAAIYGFLTVNRIVLPECVDLCKDVLYHSLKNRKWSQIFFDISYILSRSDDAHTVLSFPILFPAIDIMALFQGRPTIKREAVEHVEYESNDYGVYFSSISVVCRFAEDISKRITKLTAIADQELPKDAIGVLASVLQKIEIGAYPGILSSSIDVVQKVEYEVVPNSQVEIPRFSVNSDNVSFLHPLHAFLSWMIQLIDFGSHKDLIDFFDEINMTQKKLISIFDYPIRTVVLLSQIKVGYWVRNGFSVRQQLHIYRNTGIRECGFMRDLFMIQVLLNLIDRDVACYLLISRWQLIPWMNGDFKNYAVYGISKLPYMVEECLNFFLCLLSEDTFLSKKPNEEITEMGIKKEIIHTLCFKPLTYSKLCSEVPEHVASEKKFEIILKQISNYSPPKSTTDSGTYKLKDKYFDEIDPYYIHFTSNRRDDAIKIIKERIHKKTGRDVNDIYIEPRRISYGCFTATSNFTCSPFFGQFVCTSLRYVYKEGVSKADSILDLTLHLLHTIVHIITTNGNSYAFQEFYLAFVKDMGFFEKNLDSVAKILYYMLEDESYKSFHSKVRAIFNSISTFDNKFDVYLETSIIDFKRGLLEYELIQNTIESEFERKKRIAKERQVKLMAKFRKQQSKFVENNYQHDFDKSDIEMDEAEDSSAWKFPEEHCILCQNSGNSSEPFGIISYVSKSSEFRNIPFEDNYWFQKSFSGNINLDEEELPVTAESSYNEVKNKCIFGPGFPSKKLDAVHSELVSNSCGHGMHYSCYMSYIQNIRNRQNQITRTIPEDFEQKEFLCPLCKAINNMFIPVLWNCNKRSFVDYVSSRPDGYPAAFQSLALNSRDPDWLIRFPVFGYKDLRSLAEGTLSKVSARSIFGPSNNEKERIKSSIGTLMKNLVSITFPYVFRGDSNVLLVQSIKSTEIALRGVPSEGKLVIHQLSNNCLTNLRTWAEFKYTWLAWKAHTEINSNRPSSAFEENLATLLCLSSNNFNSLITGADFFSILVSIVPIESLGFTFNSILHMCFMGHLLQTIYKLTVNLSYRQAYDSHIISLSNTLQSTSNSGFDGSISQGTNDIFEKVLKALNKDDTPNDMIPDCEDSGSSLYHLVVKCCTPFLRRAAIWANVVSADISDLCQNYDEFVLEADKLSNILKLPTISTLIKRFSALDSYENEKLSSFVSHLETINEPLKPPPMEYPGVIKLIDLPERLDHFFTKYYYPEIEKRNKIEDPAICLFCAEVVDIQKQAVGSLNGQCTSHYQKECNNEYGVFLAPKHGALLLLYRKNGSFYPAPYLDIHGELDEDGKHGQPLYLSKLRYDDFVKNFWLGHNIPNYITRKLEGVIDIGGWETL